jgi:hypothetical protein
MPANADDAQGSDRRRVDVDDASDVEYWTLTLNTTREDLVAAVGQVGPVVADVRAQLARQPKRDRA